MITPAGFSISAGASIGAGATPAGNSNNFYRQDAGALQVGASSTPSDNQTPAFGNSTGLTEDEQYAINAARSSTNLTQNRGVADIENILAAAERAGMTERPQGTTCQKKKKLMTVNLNS